MVHDAVIVSGARTAIARAPKGSLSGVRPDDLAATVIREAVSRATGLDPCEIDDVVLGCSIPEAEQGSNVARIARALAGLPNSVSAVTVNRFCSSGLQAIAIAAQQITGGMADVCVAGGTESMSRVFVNVQPAPNPTLVREAPQHYVAMGHTAEEVARRFGITRQAQDAFGLESHRRAAAAIAAGRFQEEIVPVSYTHRRLDGGRQVAESRTFAIDEGVRTDASLESMGKLKPAFSRSGSVTAANSSQMSDGAAAVVIMSSRRAAALGLKPLAIFRGFATAGCDPEIMGVGPVVAVPKLLSRTGVRLQDVGLIELNEAFASQAVHVIRTLGLDPEVVNVNGGAIAMGHPLGATGARLTVSLMHEAARRKSRYGIVTMCVGGGMGAAGLFEFAA